MMWFDFITRMILDKDKGEVGDFSRKKWFENFVESR
jgi:hypothetical protein